MSITTINVSPIDPYLKTGPSRMMSGPVRMRSATLDTPYGEFATWLYVGTTGNVSITQWDGTTLTFTGLAAGVWHPIASIMVQSSGTTAEQVLYGS